MIKCMCLLKFVDLHNITFVLQTAAVEKKDYQQGRNNNVKFCQQETENLSTAHTTTKIK